MKKLILSVITLSFVYNSYTQSSLPKNVADSLWEVWTDEQQPDTNRLKAIYKYAWNGYLFSNHDSAFYYAQLQYDFAKAKGLKKQMAGALYMQGISFALRGENDNAIDFYNQCIKIQNEMGDKKGIAGSLIGIGNLYTNMGDYNKAIEHYSSSLKISEELNDKPLISSILGNIGVIYANQGDYINAIYFQTKSLKLAEELGNKKGIANSLNSIGTIYSDQNDYENAIKYYNKSLKFKEEINDKNGVATTLNNIGAIFYRQEDYIKAMEYYSHSLKIRQEIGDKQGEASSLNNLGNIYLNRDDNVNAIKCYNKSLKIRQEIEDKQGIAGSLINLGQVYFELGKHFKALDYSGRALIVAQEVGFTKQTKAAALSLWKINKKLGKHKEALAMHELYIQMRDSIESEENQKEVIRQEFKYNYEKKAAIDSIANAKEKEIKDAKIAQQQTEIKAKRNQQYALFGGMFLVIVFAGVMYNRFRVTRKQKVIIEEKERETHAQKEIIEEKHKEITDSINYAERIQRSFLATTEMLDEYLNDYFVFFRPKDVVSGDFYWAAKLNNGNFAFACADSTGHGVPGAIMSILNISSLEKSIETQTEPHKILHETRKIIINRLKKDGSAEGGKDGMDCSLLVLNQEKNHLTFASANNSVFIIRNGEILEFKGDKMPVGKHDNADKIFTLHSVDLQQGDVIYSLTDGFPDQFGGNKGKKYMIKNLKNLLLEIAALPLKEQEEKLANEFDKWKGSEEQVDDVCIIGVRV